MEAPKELRFHTGRPCLDFIATVGSRSRRSGHPTEKLDAPERLHEWLVGAQLLPVGSTVTITENWLPPFHRLRAVIYRVIHAVTWGELIEQIDINTLNTHLAHPVPTVQLSLVAGEFRLSVSRHVDQWSVLAMLATDTATLLTGEDRSRLRECAASICGVIYLDFVHGRERMWCSNSVCGNRERIARYRQKKRDAQLESQGKPQRGTTSGR